VRSLENNQENKNKEIESPIVSFPYGEEYTTSLYRMHKYWGRKPPNVIAQYIKNYCPKNGIVLDPFLGSGTSAIEAIRHGRKIVGIDINPLAIFITKTTLKPVRLTLLEASFRSIVNELSTISSWYETQCTRCGDKAYISYVVHFREDDNLNHEVPKEILYKCTCTPRTQIKKPDNKDYDLIEASRQIKITDWYPMNLDLPQIRPGIGEARGIKDLYTWRNLYSLSKLYSAIFHHSSGPVRDCLLLAFSSSLPQCSRLSGVDHRQGRVSAMGWILTSFRVMKEHIERNPLEAFCFAFDRVLKGKIEANSELIGYSEAETVNEIFHGKATALIRQASVNDLQDILEGNQVDYVFTDPPHGPSLQYMKLSTLSNAWLKMPLHSEEEIIQEMPSQASQRDYANKLQLAFKNIRNVVSKSAKIHVYFRTQKKEDWLSAAGTIVGGGFKLIKTIFQPQRYSFRTTFRGRGGDTSRTSHPGDWILHLKPDHEVSGSTLDIEAIEKKITEETEFILRERAQPTRLKYILMLVASKVPSEVLTTDPELIVRTLEKHLGDKFIKQDQIGSSNISDEFWSLIEIDETTKTLDSRVEDIAVQALVGREAVDTSRLYLYQAIYSRFPTFLTPDQTTIENVIEKVSERKEGKGGGLYLKDEYIKQKKRHSELILALLRIGLRNNFKVYASPRALKRIKMHELISEWHKISDDYPGRIISLDELAFNNPAAELSNVLWLNNGNVHAHFEVEQTASIDNSTFERGNQIREQWPGSERILVVPHNTIEFVKRDLDKRESFWHVAPYYAVLRTDDPTTYQPFEPKEIHAPASVRPLRLRIASKEDIQDSAGETVAFRLKLRCPSDVLKRIRPGHFLMVEINSPSRQYLSKYQAGNSWRPLKRSPSRYPEKLEFLRIPLSIHRVYYEYFEPASFKHRSRDFLPSFFWEWIQPGEKKYLDLLIRLVGHGTKTLHRLKEDDIVNVIGPLGKEINFPLDLENAVLISGGVGLASLYPVAHHLRERGYRVILLAGSRDKRTLMNKLGKTLPEFAEMGVECHVADEINDNKLVTDLFYEWLNSEYSNGSFSNTHIYSCGPWPMLKEVHKITIKWELPCTVLVDKLMLCGVGACMSCVIRTVQRENSLSYKDDHPIKMLRSCVDGPAFDSRDIVWS